MYQAQIEIAESTYQKLLQLSKELGKKENEVISLAILNFKSTETKRKNRLKLLKSAKGMWIDKTGTPNFSELRKEWDRMLSYE